VQKPVFGTQQLELAKYIVPESSEFLSFCDNKNLIKKKLHRYLWLSQIFPEGPDIS
jgi:hypothetical protein